MLEARRLGGGQGDDLDARGDRVEGEIVAVAREEPDREPEAVGGDGGVEGGAARPRRLAEPVEREVPDDDEIGRRQGRSALAMISFMISLVPPPMVRSRASRANRSIGYSRM